MKRKITAVCLLAVSSSAFSAFLDNGSYSTDTQSGLDWLDVTETIGQSFNQVSSKLSSGSILDGWRFATGNEFDQLLINLGFAPTSGGCINTTRFCTPNSISLQVFTAPIIHQIGDTSGGNNPIDPPENFFGWTRGLLADSVPDFDRHFTSIIDFDRLTTHDTSLSDDTVDPIVGAFLVREPAAVPLPAAAWLFLSAIGGIAGFRAKKKISSNVSKLKTHHTTEVHHG